MSNLNRNSYVRVDSCDIPIGEPIGSSIYSESGQLLLMQGQTIVSERQQLRLIKNGYIDPYEAKGLAQAKNKSKQLLKKHLSDLVRDNLLSAKRAKELQSEIWFSYKADDIITSGSSSAIASDNLIEVKNTLVNNLQYSFNLLTNNEYIKFRFAVVSLALNIQIQCSIHSDGLLGAIQIDRELGYSLITSIKRAVISELVGKRAGLDELERIPMICGALTCDMGYVETQNELANQSTPVTDEQRKKIKAHPIISEEKLLKAGVDSPVWLEVVRHHHERYDGSGYPDLLCRDEISMPANITALADAYSAMLTQTSFRGSITCNQALKSLFAERDKSFGRQMVSLFIKVMGHYPIGSLVRLKNKEIAVVISNTASSQAPNVLALVRPDGSFYLNKEHRDTRTPEYKVIGAVPFDEYNILQNNLEKLWGGYFQ